MITIVFYIIIIAIICLQAVKAGDPWWYGLLVFAGLVIMLVIGDWFFDMLGRIFFPDKPTRKEKKKKQYAQKLLKDDSPNHPSSRQIVVYEGEVVENETDYPQLNSSNPLPPSRRIANVKTYKEGDGGFFAATPMWCDKCRHYPIHFHIDGAWVCQCPWHDEGRPSKK